eukprot:5559337-Prymnesium_polylepis.1
MLWEVPQLDGAAPSARVGHCMVCNGHTLYVYGGASGGRPLSELYVLDLSRSYWERAILTDPRAEGPPALVGHAAAFVEVGQQSNLAKDSVSNIGKKLLVFGGGDGRRAGNTTLVVDVETLETHPLDVRGTPPLARVGHACALVKGSLLYVFGGFVRKLGYMFDVHVLNLDTAEWKQLAAGGTVPDGRINHSLCALDRQLYLFGGAFKGVPFGDLFRFDAASHEWFKLSPGGLAPTPRSAHTA